MPYVCEPPKPEQLPAPQLLLAPSPAVKPPPTPPALSFPPPPPPPATRTRVANDAAVAKALGPDTVPVATEPARVAVVTAYDKVLLAAFTAVTVNEPSNGEPTPETTTALPATKPCVSAVVKVATLACTILFVTTSLLRRISVAPPPPPPRPAASPLPPPFQPPTLLAPFPPT